MGIEGRDWNRDDGRRGGGGAPRASRIGLALGCVVGALVLLAVSPTVRDRLGYELPFGLEHELPGAHTGGALVVPSFVGIPRREQLYAPNDPWRDWLADELTCPGGESAGAPPAAQAATMLCLVNYARRREGVPPLVQSPVLDVSAAEKALDIVRCDEFEHAACGKAPDEVAREVGYPGAWGENLYVAEGPLVVPRVALDKWLNSDGHRENLFRPEWRAIGLARLPDANVDRIRDGVIWVQHFGVYTGTAPLGTAS
jgi:hypothetical protein